MDKLLSYNDHILRDSSVDSSTCLFNDDGYMYIGTGFHTGVPIHIQSYTCYNAVDSTGRIYVGNIRSYNDIDTGGCVARLTKDGSLDTLYKVGNPTDGLRIYGIWIDRNDKLLIAGDFQTWKDSGEYFQHHEGYITRRTNSGGDVGQSDNTFECFISNGVINTIYSCADGKYLVGGAFIASDVCTGQSLLRLNANGRQDTSFTPLRVAGYIIYDIKVDESTGQIYAAGSCVQGLYQFPVIKRFNSNGTIDSTFDVSLGLLNDARFSSIILEGDKIYGSGMFFSDGDVSVAIPIVKYNTSDGSRDMSFNIDPSPFFYPTDKEHWKVRIIKADDKIYATGHFSTATETYSLVSYNDDGTYNSDFAPFSSVESLLGYTGSGDVNTEPAWETTLSYSAVNNRLYLSGKFDRVRRSSTLFRKFLSVDLSGNNMTIANNFPPIIFDVSIDLGILPFENDSFALKTGFVDWGDGSVAFLTSQDGDQYVHQYSTGGMHTITLDGEFWEFYGKDDWSIIGIKSFGKRLLDNEYDLKYHLNLSHAERLRYLPDVVDEPFRYLATGKEIFMNTKLKTIPAGLLKGANASDYSFAFFSIETLEAIPPDIFSYVHDVSIVNLDYCFAQNSPYNALRGTAPELWVTMPDVSSHYRTFFNCVGLDNYDDIPIDWK